MTHTGETQAIRVVTLRDGRTVTLRRPTYDDAAAMVAYLDAMRRASDFVQVSAADPLPTTEQECRFIDGGAGPDALMLLGVSPPGRVVAVAQVGCGRMAKTRHRAEVGISIDAAWRGAGLGKLLMHELINFCRAHGEIRKVSLSVYADNAVAIRLYESCGFVPEGRRVRHIRQLDGTFVDELVMGLWLA